MSQTLLRDGVESLTGLANADVAAIWRQLSTPDQAREAMMDVLPDLIDFYGQAAAAYAADWYDDERLALAVSRAYSASPVDLGRTGAPELARWAIEPLFGPEPRWDDALVKVQGGLQRRVANASRNTVVESSLRDPSARGWQRAGAGACSFCNLLISRGGVYTEASVAFRSHDHCHCYAVPRWDA